MKRKKKNLYIYNEILKNEKAINIPIPDSLLSTKKLLTMSWLEGEPLKKFYIANKTKRNNIAKNLFTAWYNPFYKYGIIHGDPHPGNYTISDNGDGLNLLDLGCIRIYDAKFVSANINLYIALRDNNKELAISSYESWGFKNLSKDLIDTLNIWAKYIYGPLLQDKIRPIQDNKGGSYGKEVADKVHKKLKSLGGVKPPREFVLVDRAAIGLGSIFMHLKAEINWHKLFENLIDDFSVNKLKERQKKIISKFYI